MEHLNLDVPVEPETDYQIRSAITAFYYASRGRSYLSGMSVMPLPISVRDITDVVSAHPICMDRSFLDPLVFAIDDEFLANNNKDSDKG